MASWYKASGWAKDNDRWYTKFMKGLNWAFNPNHEWFDYDSWNENSTVGKISSFLNNAAGAASTAVQQLADPQQLTSWVNSQTGAHLTGSQIEANEMAMQNQEDIYQRQVTGMQNAGLNPALMYESGASSAPSPVQGQTGNANMSDLMQAMLFDKQSKLLDAQARNTDADTDKKMAETENMKLINQYYPNLTQTTIDKMLKEIGLTDAQIEETFANVNSKNLDVELKSIEKVIKQAQADESGAYYKAIRELAEAQTDKERAEKEKLVVERAIEVIERDYMKSTNTKMGSASVLAIASFLGTIIHDSFADFDGIDLDSLSDKVGSKFSGFKSWLKKFLKDPQGLDKYQ